MSHMTRFNLVSKLLRKCKSYFKLLYLTYYNYNIYYI